ncbi:hypothetical protein E2C01_051392 [Portunus trituberculatus]|uniref:Uncharacterized protein n=1 Tax=Portunus trituberculatus TaxID=210409 RepID=A0A5B7GIZ3_PORTR|nr:hypothetical protein [Portunus trituberculatus]
MRLSSTTPQTHTITTHPLIVHLTNSYHKSFFPFSSTYPYNTNLLTTSPLHSSTPPRTSPTYSTPPQTHTTSPLSPPSPPNETTHRFTLRRPSLSPPLSALYAAHFHKITRPNPQSLPFNLWPLTRIPACQLPYSLSPHHTHAVTSTLHTPPPQPASQPPCHPATFPHDTHSPSRHHFLFRAPTLSSFGIFVTVVLALMKERGERERGRRTGGVNSTLGIVLVSYYRRG